MLISVPLMFLTKMTFQGSMKKGLEMYFKHESKIKPSLIEYIKNIVVIKSFAKDEKTSREILNHARKVYYIEKFSR